MIFIGVDPGKTGGLVAISETREILVARSIPMTGNEYDLPGLLQWLRGWLPDETHVAYEALHAMPMKKGGTKANFSRGYVMGAIETALAALRLPSTPVRAQAWQKVMFAGQTVAKGESKAAALIAAKRLWPSKIWTVGQGTKPHEGIVDAALIAEWCRREIS